jgi:hypothetical protein
MTVQAEPMFAKEAKKRQASSTGGKKPQLKERIPEPVNGQARDAAAKAAGTNGHYISDVKAIARAACHKLKAQHKAGEYLRKLAKDKGGRPVNNSARAAHSFHGILSSAPELAPTAQVTRAKAAETHRLNRPRVLESAELSARSPITARLEF